MISICSTHCVTTVPIHADAVTDDLMRCFKITDT